MSAQISDDLRRLPSIIEEEFGRALVDDIAPAVAAGWKGRIVELDLIDSGNYLESIGVGEVSEGGKAVVVEAPGAAGYAAAIRRKGESDYVGRRVAEEGIQKAEGDIRDALNRAGDRVKG